MNKSGYEHVFMNMKRRRLFCQKQNSDLVSTSPVLWKRSTPIVRMFSSEPLSHPYSACIERAAGSMYIDGGQHEPSDTIEDTNRL